MNPILLRQNEWVNLRKLAAQRELYAKAKRVQGWQILVVVFVSAVLATVAIWHEAIAGVVALYSIAVTLVDFLGFEPAIATLKKRGAQVQESFDCGVFGIECSVFKATDPEIEDVIANSAALLKLKTDEEKLRDWYPDEINTLSVELGRLVCQRSNFAWDARLRKSYSKFLLVPALFIIVLIPVICLLKQIDFEHFALIDAAALPAVLFFLKQRRENQEATERLQELTSLFGRIWEKAHAHTMSPLDFEKASRQIQDEIYDHRARSPLVMDFYYWARRKKDQWIMSTAAEGYAAE